MQIHFSYSFVGFTSISNDPQCMVTNCLTKRGTVYGLHLQELKRRQAMENPCREVLYFVSVENPATQRTAVCKDTGHSCTQLQSVRTKDTPAHSYSL